MKEKTIAFRIIIEKPVPGIPYGIQSGSGHNYQTLQKQVAESGDLTFDFAMPAKKSREGNWVWHGPITQGPPGNRFLYLDIGSYAGQEHILINGRLKIPLPDLSEKIIDSVEKVAVFMTKIHGVNAKNGKPYMGTVKPFDGWNVKGI